VGLGEAPTRGLFYTVTPHPAPLTPHPQVEQYVHTVLNGRTAFQEMKSDRHQRLVARSKVVPIVNALEKALGMSIETLKRLLVSKGRAEKARLKEISDIKQAGVKEYREELEKSALARVVTERFGAGVSLAVMEALANAASLETRSEAAARGGNKRTYFPKRSVEKTWLLADVAQGVAYKEAVGISEEVHRALPRETRAQRDEAEEFDDMKLHFYLALVFSTIAAHCSEAPDVEVTPQQLLEASDELTAARELDDTCVPACTYAVNFAHVARELRVASGARSELTTPCDGGQVITDILARCGIAAGLFVPAKRVHGTRAQRRGARTFLMPGGRKERGLRAVTRGAAAVELARLEESGVVDVGHEFPPRLFIEKREEDGTTTRTPLGACGRILDLRTRITKRVNEMMESGLTRLRPRFEAMDEEEAERYLTRFKLPLQGKEKGKEETLESVRTRLRIAWLRRTSDRSQPAVAGGKCTAGCDECEVSECCSAEGCGKSRAVWACTCGAPAVMRCGRCGRLGRRSASDVCSALCTLGEEAEPTSSSEQRLVQLDRLVAIERMHSVSETLVQLGQPAWLAAEGVGPHAPLDLHDGAREARLLTAQLAVRIRIALWADGSPMLNKPWQLCTWHLMYDPLLFAHGRAAERECRRCVRMHVHVHVHIANPHLNPYPAQT
jgi:hypothetical protein